MNDLNAGLPLGKRHLTRRCGIKIQMARQSLPSHRIYSGFIYTYIMNKGILTQLYTYKDKDIFSKSYTHFTKVFHNYAKSSVIICNTLADASRPIGISDLDHESEIMLIFVALFNLKRYETDS